VKEGLFSSSAPGGMKLAEMWSKPVIFAVREPAGRVAESTFYIKKNHHQSC